MVRKKKETQLKTVGAAACKTDQQAEAVPSASSFEDWRGNRAHGKTVGKWLDETVQEEHHSQLVVTLFSKQLAMQR